MVRWEYREELISSVSKTFVDQFNKLGDEGWELVCQRQSAVDVLVCTFKRPMTPGSPYRD